MEDEPVGHPFGLLNKMSWNVAVTNDDGGKKSAKITEWLKTICALFEDGQEGGKGNCLEVIYFISTKLIRFLLSYLFFQLLHLLLFWQVMQVCVVRSSAFF